MKTLEQLEAAWHADNQRFATFQRLANRDMQLARFCLEEKERVDLEILSKMKNRVSAPIGERVLLAKDELSSLTDQLDKLTRRLVELSDRQAELTRDEAEQVELRTECDIMREQIKTVKDLMPLVNGDMLPRVKQHALAEIDKFHHINTAWQADELTGVHITLNSLQTKNEESIAEVEPISFELTALLNQVKRENGSMRRRKEKTRKNVDSFKEWVGRIQQERFNNEVDCLLIQNEVDKLEDTYKANFESNFRRGEQLEARIIDTRGKLYEVDILESELEKERAFRIKRSDELVMLEKALQQQDSDYAAEIDKLERKLAKQQIDT